MSVCDTEMQNAVISKLCGSLLNDDKRKRKKALEELSQEIFKDPSDPTFNDKVRQAFNPILRCFSDKAEAIRESAIYIVTEILNSYTNFDDNQFLPHLIPNVKQRIGSSEIVESSEEVRLLLVSLLRVIIKKCQTKVALYIDDFIKILVQTIVDPYPRVKKESCECASELAVAVPQHFHLQSESLVKPVLQNFTHQHYKVRVSAIKCIGDVLRYGNSNPMNDVCGPLAQRLFDQTPMVRQAVNKVVGMWFLELRDRYSYFHKLLPILLTSLNDDSPDLRTEAWAMWEAAGNQYIAENEGELKDQMDFMSEPPEHYPPNVIRPNLGCRTLVSRHLSKIVPPLTREMSDWLDDVRVKAVQLLCVLLLNAESQMTHHLERILPSMYVAATEQDQRLVDNIDIASLYIGYFVPCETYWTLVLPTMEDNTNAGHLRVLAAIMRGTHCKELLTKLEEVADFISSDSVCRSKEPIYQQQVLSCCETMLTVCQKDCTKVSHQLFTALITVLGLAASQTVETKAKDLLNGLVEQSGCSLFEEHMPFLLEKVKKTVDSWNIHCPERYIFDALLAHSGEIVGLYLAEVIPIFTVVLNPNKDAELRLKCIMALSSLLTNFKISFQRIDHPGSYLTTIIRDVISPNLVWHAGRSSEAIRTAAVGCLVMALQSDPISDKATLEEVTAMLTPLLLSLIEDSSKKTRLYSLTSMRLLVSLMQANDLLTRDELHKIYPVVLKRLDDTADDCRAASVKTLKVLFHRAPSDYNALTAKPHLDALFNAMLIHFDDMNPNFQEIMLDALKETGKICPQLLLEKVNQLKPNFRNKSGLDELAAFLESRID